MLLIFVSGFKETVELNINANDGKDFITLGSFVGSGKYTFAKLDVYESQAEKYKLTDLDRSTELDAFFAKNSEEILA